MAAGSAAPVFPAPAGNIALLGHVGLYVGSRGRAEAFYCGFLGFVPDPRVQAGPGQVPDHFYVNMGLNQLHLPLVGRRDVRTPQAIRGAVEVVYPAEEFARLEALAAEAACEPGELAVRRVSSEVVEVACPWGNVFRCVASGDVPRLRALLAAQGSHPGEEAQGVGLSRVEILCPVGSGPAIARFYAEMLGAKTAYSEEDGCAEVKCGGMTSLCYIESPEYVELRGWARGEERDQWNVALYLRDFDGTYARFEKEGLEWEKDIGSFSSVESGAVTEVFRFKDVRDLETGETILELEHEVRSLRHPACPLGSARLHDPDGDTPLLPASPLGELPLYLRGEDDAPLFPSARNPDCISSVRAALRTAVLRARSCAI